MQQDNCYRVPQRQHVRANSTISAQLELTLPALLRRKCLCYKLVQRCFNTAHHWGCSALLLVQAHGPTPRQLLLVKSLLLRFDLLGGILKHLFCILHCASRLLAHLMHQTDQMDAGACWRSSAFDMLLHATPKQPSAELQLSAVLAATHLLGGLIGCLLVLVERGDEGGQHRLLARGLGQLGGARRAAVDDALQPLVLLLEVVRALDRQTWW